MSDKFNPVPVDSRDFFTQHILALSKKNSSSRAIEDIQRIETLEIMLKIEQAKSEHLKNLIILFEETKTTGCMFDMFEYVAKI